MDWLNILNQIFEVCLIPLLGLATTTLIFFVRAKIAQAKATTKNDTAIQYLSVLEQTIVDCINATNQTYVNNLKDKNAFTIEAQKEALSKTATAVSQVLSEDVKNHLTTLFGDLETLIIEKIEANIKQQKK